jgi:phosphorylase/glycogen(starch) synthase
MAGEIELWKSKIAQYWPEIKVTSIRLPDSSINPVDLGENFEVEVILDTNGISPEDIGVEIVIGNKVLDKIEKIYQISDLNKTKVIGSEVTFKCALKISDSGVFDIAFRIYPKSEFLAHRQDFPLVKWI